MGLQLFQNTEIIKQTDILLWKIWRKYGSVSCLFSCTFIFVYFEVKPKWDLDANMRSWCEYSLYKFQVIIRSMGKKQTETGPFQKVKGIPQRPQTQKWPLRARKRKRSQVGYLIWKLRIATKSEINFGTHHNWFKCLLKSNSFSCKSTAILPEF